MNKTLRPARDFTPAVPVLGAYDPIVSLFTRERHWRSALLAQLAPRPSDVIADVGCGTGSFLALLGRSGSTPRLIKKRATAAARAADSSQFDGNLEVLMGSSSVCPSTSTL